MSSSKNGQFISVAGNRGFAHFNILSNKWKMFGNEHQEQSFEVTSMVWYRTLIIVACINFNLGGAFEIRVFSRETKLDVVNALHIVRLATKATQMTLTGNNLLVYTTDCLIQSYIINIIDGKQATLELRQAFSLTSFVGHESESVQAICRFRSQDSQGNDLSSCPILLLKGGNLFLIAQAGKGWMAVRLSTHVEHFWVSQSRQSNCELLQSSIWVFDGTGVKVL
jgi:hypothetical protein